MAEEIAFAAAAPGEPSSKTVLRLTFDLEGEDGDTMVMSISGAKAGLDWNTVSTAAAQLVPVLVSSSGAAATALKSAEYVTTTTTAIEQE